MRAVRWGVVVLAMLGATAARAEGLRIGVYLPASISDADERFGFAESLAAALSKGGVKASARSFARYEDLAKAITAGEVDLTVVDAFATGYSKTEGTPVALAARGQTTSMQWVIVAREAKPVAKLAGAQVAVVRSPGAFLQNVVLGGELPANHFKQVPVPSVESALKMLEAGSVEAALLPRQLAPADAKIVFTSGPVPGAVVMAVKADAEKVRADVLAAGGISPFTKFLPARDSDLAEVRRELAGGGGARSVPALVDSPAYRLDPTEFAPFKAASPVLPDFLPFVEASKELPDD